MNIKLQAPAGLNSVNWNGERYEVVNGVVEVPKAAFDELTRPIHGFTVPTDGVIAHRPSPEAAITFNRAKEFRKRA